MTYTKNGKTYHCTVEATLDVIGGKWKPLILWHLGDNVMRFGELQRALPGVNGKMLTKQLRELEEDGVIRRKVYPEVPPRVEYAITEFGKTLIPILQALCTWGALYLDTENGGTGGSAGQCPAKTGKKKEVAGEKAGWSRAAIFTTLIIGNDWRAGCHDAIRWNWDGYAWPHLSLILPPTQR